MTWVLPWRDVRAVSKRRVEMRSSLGEGVRVVEQQVLTGIAEVADGSGRVHGDGVAGGDAVVIDDLVGVTIAGGIEEEQTDAGHAFEAIHAVAVEGDVKGVGIALHAGGLAPSEDFRFSRRPFSDCLRQSGNQARRRERAEGERVGDCEAKCRAGDNVAEVVVRRGEACPGHEDADDDREAEGLRECEHERQQRGAQGHGVAAGKGVFVECSQQWREGCVIAVRARPRDPALDRRVETVQQAGIESADGECGECFGACRHEAREGDGEVGPAVAEPAQRYGQRADRGGSRGPGEGSDDAQLGCGEACQAVARG